MERKEDDSRWLLIKHEKCGSVITIRSRKFLDSQKLHDQSSNTATSLACPSCIGTTIKSETITKLHKFLINYHELIKSILSKALTIGDVEGLVRSYHELTQALKSEGFLIREIREEIRPERLKL
jgi:hypothetical protein